MHYRLTLENSYFTRFALTLLCSLLITSSYGQNLFPEKFKGCVTDQFSLESDSISAKVDNQTLIAIVTHALNEEETKSAIGTLALQIIVDRNGQSCLLSVKNDTNLKTKKLRLKENIDSRLLWEKVDNKVAAVVVLRFSSGTISVKRLGMNGKRGVHELRP
ncbi:hypothetical protein [Hymenobacter wooponensis]|uniref:Uncharacterized protein n=1 Tax=Hymenobacter wooponensis TaxID=1525360 RepID=A0A4Z0MUC7_9BACT|nr:hypothetical protein [Hymenobacter wooponensis]TGD82918.1 hypothetical protein EU557_03830 [Hymenobacter wooponensis]